MNGTLESPMFGGAPAVSLITGTENQNLTPAVEEKKCSHCKTLKSYDDFTPNQSWCKECNSKRQKESRAHRPGYREKCNARTKLWREKNQAKVVAYSKQFKMNNPEVTRKNMLMFNQKNPDYAKQHRGKNLEKMRQKGREYAKKRVSTPQGKLRHAVSRGIWTTIRSNKGGKHWENLVGYTLDQLKRHLEKLFKPGMTWDNYGLHGWHIDHKIPVAAFNFETSDDIDFKKCWALKNLQPLWAGDNIRKRAKLVSPFQPSLLGVY